MVVGMGEEGSERLRTRAMARNPILQHDKLRFEA
jgi:hypothetical protein